MICKENTKLKEMFKNKTRVILYMYNMALVLFTEYDSERNKYITAISINSFFTHTIFEK